MAELKPPSPRASTSAAFTGVLLGSPSTMSRAYSGAGDVFIVGGISPCRIESSAVTRSSDAAPEHSRPVIVLGAVTGTPRGPNTALMAVASERSSSGIAAASAYRSEEHTSELQSLRHL